MTLLNGRAISRRTLGFTIVELIVVVVVIAIVASIAMVSYNGIRERAEATAIRSTISQIDTGLRIKAFADGLTSWPRDNSFDGTNNPNLATLIANGNAIKDYIPNPSGISPGVQWYYDNDAASTTTNAIVCADPDTNWDGAILAIGPP